jgi:hypothetical protein
VVHHIRQMRMQSKRHIARRICLRKFRIHERSKQPASSMRASL